MGLRVVFMGTPDFSVPTLRAIAASRHDIVGVYSQPPRAGGRRGLEIVKSPVHKAAEELGLTVFSPENFKQAADIQAFTDLNADVAVVVAYGLLLPQAVLDVCPLGFLNGHASLLPRWRGAAPIHRAVMAGDTHTAMMIMKMEAGLDTGPVGLTDEVKIGSDMTSGQLHDQLMVKGADLMVDALNKLEDGTLYFTPQNTEGMIYARKIQKSETKVDWNKPAHEVHNHIRGLSPSPGAWCEMKLGGKIQRVKLLASRIVDQQKDILPGTVCDDNLTIACKSGAVQLMKLQKAGKDALSAEDFQRGTPLLAGQILS